MRIGLFFTRINGIMDPALDLDYLAGHYSAGFFVYVCDDFFNIGHMQEMLSCIKENRLEAVLLIGESPFSYRSRRSGDHILNEIQALGVNDNRIGFVNLKEQVAEVHSGQRIKATQKAKLLIDAEIERVREAEPLKVIEVVPRKSVAVIGAAGAGFLAAQQLLQKGYAVFLIDSRQDRLKGLAGNEGLKPVFAFVEKHPRYTPYSGAVIKDIYGLAGDFSMELTYRETKVLLSVGAIVVADSGDRQLVGEIRPFLHFDIDEQGLFRPRNRETMPAYTSEEGVFLAQNHRSDPARTVMSADSAALAVIGLLESPEIRHRVAVSEINRRLCGGCGTCVKTCLFHACKIDPAEKWAVIDQRRCKGCGSCVTACPAGARDLLTYPQKYLFKAVDTLSQYDGPGEKKILLFLCEGCGYQAMDAAAGEGLQYPVGAMPLKVRCGGTIDTQLILYAYKKGFDGVVICKCQSGHCSNIAGNLDLDRRANLFREILRSRGIDIERLRIVDCVQTEGNSCVQALLDLQRYLEKTGVNTVE